MWWSSEHAGRSPPRRPPEALTVVDVASVQTASESCGGPERHAWCSSERVPKVNQLAGVAQQCAVADEFALVPMGTRPAWPLRSPPRSRSAATRRPRRLAAILDRPRGATVREVLSALADSH